MMCYKDKTYCAGDCNKKECHRYLSEEVKREAEMVGLPLDTTDFSTECRGYKPKETRND